jgi:hypothetical protein
MKGKGPSVPAIESPNSPPATVEVNNVTGESTLARKATKVMEFVVNTEKEMLGCCDEAEALIEKCRQTKDDKVCQQATREMALCMHYQQETSDW